MAVVNNISVIQAAMRRQTALKWKALTMGLKECGTLLQRESQKIVPVDYGNLKATAFTRSQDDGTSRVIVTVGYTAGYAVYVHENLDALHGAAFNAAYRKELSASKKRQKAGGRSTGPFRHPRGKNQQAKFLEAPFRRLRSVFAQIIQMRTKI